MTTFDQAYRGIRQIGEIVVSEWAAAEGRQMKGRKRTKENLVKKTDSKTTTKTPQGRTNNHHRQM